MARKLSIKKAASAALFGALLLAGDKIFALSRSSGAFETSAYPGVAAPVVGARSVVVLDAASGAVLYAKNPDLVIRRPRSTKLVTLHIVYEEIQAGRLSEDDIVTIDKRDCSPYIPYGSSLMYLRPGMHVSVRDLMQGAAVVSGNDAAFALARAYRAP